MPMQSEEELARATAAVISRAMNDADFRAVLIADPASTLRAEGFAFSDDLTINVLQSSSTQGYLVIPSAETLSDEFLAAASGGGTASSAGSASTAGTIPFTLSTASCAGSAGCAG